MISKSHERQLALRIGGFTGQNSGEIIDCFATVRLIVKKGTTHRFAGENTGELENCLYENAVKKPVDGVTGGGNGNADKWLFDITKSPLYMDLQYEYFVDAYKHASPEPEPIAISTANELFDLAGRINSGDKVLASKYIRLEEDINLGGREWVPIGTEPANAFVGLFDGNGYKVTNFRIKDKGTKAKGFFGYLKGEVYNLAVDCNIKAKDGVAGGIAACCEGGVIGNCIAVLDLTLDPKCERGTFGGLAGINTGWIFDSSAEGKLGKFSVADFLRQRMINRLLMNIIMQIIIKSKFFALIL